MAEATLRQMDRTGLREKSEAEQTAALQSLAAQIASAIHRAETYQQRIASEKMARELEIVGKIQAIQQAVQTFAGEAPQADYITLLLVQRSSG